MYQINWRIVKLTREKKLISSGDFAKRLGIPIQVYSNYEVGRRTPRENQVDLLKNMSIELGTTMDDLIFNP